MPSPLRSLRRLPATLNGTRARHAARRRPTGFRFAVADDIAFLNAADWDSAAEAGGFFMSRSYLRVLTDQAPVNLQTRYALVYGDNQPVAAVAVQVVDIEGARLMKAGGTIALSKSAKDPKRKSLLKKALTPLGKKAVKGLRERVLVCGNLLSWGNHGVSFALGVDHASVWPAVSEALYRIRRAEKLLGDASLLVIKDLDEAAMTDAQALKTFSYRPLKTDPNMVLECQPSWKSYDDYLASLDGKYRKSARQLSEALGKAGVTLETRCEVAAEDEALHSLYLQVHNAATVRPVTLLPSYLRAVSSAAGEAGFRCTIAKQGERVVGFVASVKDRDTSVGYYIGYDRGLAATGVPLYLRLLHSTVEHALQMGCTRVSLGRTALEPKARLGARPVAFHLWTRHRVPAMNWLLRAVLGAVPHEEAPERNPFKQ